MTSPICVVAAGDLLGEGARWDHRTGSLFWLDIEGRRVHRLRPDDGAVTTWDIPSMPAAIGLREGGGLVLATDRGLEVFAPDTGALEPVTTLEPDRPGNRANDGGVDPQGRFWVGTMSRSATARTGAVYRCDPSGAVTRVLDGLGIPNTFAWSDGGAVLYLADSLDRTIYRYAVTPADGSLSGREVFASATGGGFPDGSTLDAEGCLWNAEWDGGRLVRYSPDGDVDRMVAMPVSRPTSCVFGGADLATLYVTSASTGLTPAELEHQPLAGGLFALQPGVVGSAATPWGG